MLLIRTGRCGCHGALSLSFYDPFLLDMILKSEKSVLRVIGDRHSFIAGEHRSKG